MFSRSRLVLMFAVLAIAGSAFAALSLIGNSNEPAAPQKPMTSSIWKKGTTWDVKRSQNTGDIKKENAGTVYVSIYRFKVTSVPTTSKGLWAVRAHLVGAGGPLADGYTLKYRETKSGSMKLSEAALGGGADVIPVDVGEIGFLVGPNFPLTKEYSSPPKSYTMPATVR